MKRKLFLLVLIISSLGIIACAIHPSSINGKDTLESSKTIIPKNKSVFDTRNECKDWKRVYGLLTDKKKEILQREGVVNDSSDPDYSKGYYVLSPDLVGDCFLNLEIGRLFWLVMLEQDDETDKKFAAKNSKEIVKVLRHIWNSPAFSRDGVSQDKYYLLTYDGIKDDDIAPFVGELLKNEGLSGSESGLESTLINRPLPSLEPLISELLTQAEVLENAPQQVYFLIVLYQIIPEPKTLYKLNRMTNNPKLSDNTKIELKKIIGKLKSNIKIDYRDIEKLNMPLVVIEESITHLTRFDFSLVHEAFRRRRHLTLVRSRRG